MLEQSATRPAAKSRAHVVVVGNEKGGSGKSTTAMHLVAALLHEGYRVASLDLDARQATLSRYLENRQHYMDRNGLRLLMPVHVPIPPSTAGTVYSAQAEEKARLEEALDQLLPCYDFVVIDTPGSDNYLSRLGHSFADTLITPLNDSFVDLDNLADVDPETHRVRHPSRYAEMVWEQRKQRIQRDRGSIDWIVMRNRLSQLDSHNQQAVTRVLDALAGRIGFRPAPGFSERVIFRELFLKGLTLLDLRLEGAGVKLSMSHVAARQEVRALLRVAALHRKVAANAV